MFHSRGQSPPGVDGIPRFPSPTSPLDLTSEDQPYCSLKVDFERLHSSNAAGLASSHGLWPGQPGFRQQSGLVQDVCALMEHGWFGAVGEAVPCSRTSTQRSWAGKLLGLFGGRNTPAALAADNDAADRPSDVGQAAQRSPQQQRVFEEAATGRGAAHTGADTVSAASARRRGPHGGPESGAPVAAVRRAPLHPGHAQPGTIAEHRQQYPGPLPAPAAGAQAEPGAPFLGTWADRQRVFERPSIPAGATDAPARREAGTTSSDGTDGRMSGNADGEYEATAAGGAGNGPASVSSSAEDERWREVAWRWRFGRRWAAEQEKQFDPAYGKDGGAGEECDNALNYVEACGFGWNHQIARTTSLDKTLASSEAFEKSLAASFTLGGLSLQASGHSGHVLADEVAGARDRSSSGACRGRGRSSSGADKPELAATREIASLARKAQELMAQQRQIEARVAEQLSGAGSQHGAAWVGGHLPAAQVDSWGRFPYVLVRLYDRSGRTKVVLRAKNFANETRLVAALQEEAEATRVRQRLSGNVWLQLIGSGVMEWSRERDRHLRVLPGKVVHNADRSIQSETDVAQVACALTRGQLPMNYQVTMDLTRHGGMRMPVPGVN